MSWAIRLKRAMRTSFRPLIDLRKYRISRCNPCWLQAAAKQPAQRDVVLVTCGFGPARYQRAAERLAVQAERLGCFTRIHVFTNLAAVPGLAVGCLEQLECLAWQYPRGYGLWAWKPAVLSAVMGGLPEGAEVFYIDAGCELSAWGGPRFSVLRLLLEQQQSLFFTLPNQECEWTSAQVLQQFGLHQDEASAQVQATWFAVVNTVVWRDFILAWSDQCLLDDARLLKARPEDNNPYLIEHREDQSVLSCMLKQRGQVPTMPHQDHFLPELYRPNSWVLCMPVHTLRQAGDQSIIEPLLSRSDQAACRSDRSCLTRVGYLIRMPRAARELLYCLVRFMLALRATDLWSPSN